MTKHKICSVTGFCRKLFLQFYLACVADEQNPGIVLSSHLKVRSDGYKPA